MSYNIDSVEVLSGALWMAPSVAAAFVGENEEELAEDNFLEDHAGESAETSEIERVSWRGTWSGRGEATFVKALGLTEGVADLLLCWEGGDSFSGYRVTNGEVKSMNVKHVLVEPAPKEKA